jgi:type IV secretory pathway TraG/TraD family ATPase VirD4
VGATGTGKTVLIEKLLFEDLRRGYGAIVIDPKGERDFYDSVKAYCKSIGRENDLFFLSATFPEESAVWNPCSLGNISELQTKFFNSAIYNEPHYAKACEFGLLQAFRALKGTGKQDFTIRDLLRELKSISQDDKNETLKGLFFDLNNLVFGEWEAILGASKVKPGKEISLLEIIKGNKILFVDLPTEGKKVQSSRIGRLLTQEIILISGLRKRNPSLRGDRPFSVYIDEFDAFATESFSTFLNKGRSSEFMIHLAHQTLSDLNCVSPEFTGQIMGNCNVRFIFRQDDPDDAERWSRFLGTKNVVKQTYRTKDGASTGESSNRISQEFVIAPNTIKSLKIGHCVFSIKTDGLARTIRIPFHKKPKTTAKPPVSEVKTPGNVTLKTEEPLVTEMEKWSEVHHFSEKV